MISRARELVRAACRWAIVIVLLLAGAVPPAVAGPTESDTLLDGIRTVPLTVYLDRIGALVSIRADSMSVLDSVIGAGLTVLERHPSGLMILGLGTGMSRDSLLLVARRVRLHSGDIFLRTGLVVSGPGPYSPMLVPDEIIVQFLSESRHAPRQMEGAHPDSLPGIHGLQYIEQNPYRPEQWLVGLSKHTTLDAIRASQIIARMPDVLYAVPNFYHVLHLMSEPTEEPEFLRQWHLRNLGLADGVEDADIDADKAWTISKGSSDVVVAVMDGGFDIGHEDLEPNLWTNEHDACNGKDEDRNKYVDDVHGWDFYGCLVGCGNRLDQERCYKCDYRPKTSPDCGSNLDKHACGDLALTCVRWVPDDLHGTAVAGLIGARGDNKKGGTGVAPEVRLMLLRASIDEYLIGKMFDYAWNNGAWIINCSWRLLPGQVLTKAARDAILDAAEKGRGGKGCVIVFAMSNEARDDCTGARAHDEILMLQRSDGTDAVIAVSGSNNKDRKVDVTGYGDCMDVLAPTSGGTLHIATTDQSNADGYNSTYGGWLSACPTPSNLLKECATNNYTYCFTGTSAATPLVSGAAALVLSVNADMTAPQVQRLIQDTADKTEDASGLAPAMYDDATGFSRGTSASSTHGWGRLNAFEAVRVAASAASGGRGGADLFIRDHRLDWGNTERPTTTRFEPTGGTSDITKCVDAKVDAGPFFQSVEPTTSAEFDSFTDEQVSPGKENRIYVRVRNRGAADVPNVSVMVGLTYTAGDPAPLPADFWNGFLGRSWKEADWIRAAFGTVASIAYSGASATRSGAADEASIVRMSFAAPAASASSGGSGVLLIVVHSIADPPAALIRAATGAPASDADRDVNRLCAEDNNIAQKRF